MCLREADNIPDDQPEGLTLPHLPSSRKGRGLPWNRHIRGDTLEERAGKTG
jgi:hypothetical protein